MKKTGKLLALLLCAAMLLALLAACGGGKSGGETQEPDDEPMDWDDGAEETSAPAAENTKELDIGTRYDAGFVMDLPAGFRYDDGWCCYTDGKIQAWLPDADFYEYDHNLEDVLENAGVTGPGEKLGAFTLWTRQAEEFYGPSTHYYISFNGLYSEWAGCHIFISSLNNNYDDTFTPELTEAMKTVRRKGEAVGEQGGGASAAVKPEKPDEKPEPSPEPDQEPTTPFTDLFIVYDGAQAGEMSAFMNYGRYACSGDKLVGLGFSPDSEPVLVRMDLKRNGSFADVEDYEILSYGDPSNVCIHGDTVYFIKDWDTVCRVPLDGGQAEPIINGPTAYLQVCGDSLYFCDSDYRFCRADLDGDNVERLFDKEVYFPWMLDEEWLIYQDDADNESLHIRHIPTGADAAITDEPTYMPILYGSDLYALCGDDRNLVLIDLINPRVKYDEAAGEFSVSFDVEYSRESIGGDFCITSDGYIYTGSKTGVYIDYWKDAAGEYGETELFYAYSGEDYAVYWNMADGGISGIYIEVLETGGAQSIGHFS